MKKSMLCLGAAGLACALGFAFGVPASAEDVTLTYWSHEADEAAKVALREQVARDFEKSHPGVHVKITWYEMEGLQAALKTSLPAGQGPDIFYTEPGQEDYFNNGYVVALDDLIHWDNIYPWARKAMSVNGHAWAVPQEAYTNELYYNKDLLKKLGVMLPANGQLTQSQFLDLVKAAHAAGVTPIAQGVADRQFPGAYITTQALLKKLGPDDYGKLWAGKLSFGDPRIVEVLKWVKELVDAGAYPKDFLTIKLGESHAYFYQKPLAVMLPMGSWYTGRAFVPVDKGGQPAGFPLGVMQFPAMDNGACNECKTVSVGSSQSINAASKHKELAAEFLNAMAQPEVAKRWIETIYLQSAVKTTANAFSGEYGAYFAELTERDKGAKFFIGDPTDGLLTGQCLDTYAQVINSGFPAGLISVDDAVSEMNQACFKG